MTLFSTPARLDASRSGMARLLVVASIVAAIIVAAPVSSLSAQTDYYNTDAGRPVRIEDAYAIGTLVQVVAEDAAQ